MPKISMLGTGCYDEIIVGNAAAFRDHFPACRIDSRNFCQNDFGVLLPTDDAADWGRNISRRETRGGDLIKQGLEQVIVVAIDDRDVEWRSG